METKDYIIVGVVLIVAFLIMVGYQKKITTTSTPGTSSLPPPPQESVTGISHSVRILGSQGFDPLELRIRVGDKVIWANRDLRQKDAVLTFQYENSRDFINSEIIKPDQSWEYVFTQPGTYSYWTVGYGVNGKLIVE